MEMGNLFPGHSTEVFSIGVDLPLPPKFPRLLLKGTGQPLRLTLASRYGNTCSLENRDKAGGYCLVILGSGGNLLYSYAG